MKYNKLITSLAAATLAVSGVSATVMSPKTDNVMAARKKKSHSRTHYQTRKITRTIKMYQPKGMKKVVQKAYIKRKVTTRKHKKSTYGKWSTSQWKKYKVAKVAGYTASRSTVGAAKVTRKTKNQTIKITYKKIKKSKKHVKKYVKKAAPKKTVRRSAPASAKLTFYNSKGKRTSFWPAKDGLEKEPKKGDKVEVMGQGIINGQLMYQIAQSSDVYVPAKDVKVDYFNNVHFVDYYLGKAKYDADLAEIEKNEPENGLSDWFDAHPLENLRMWSKKTKVSKSTYEKHNLTYAQRAAQDGRMSMGYTKEAYMAYIKGEKAYRQYEAKWAAEHPNITRYMKENSNMLKKYNLNTFEWHYNDNFFINIRK